MVQLLRLITSGELLDHADEYAPFLAGSDYDRQGLDISAVCLR
jgi:hypothetical protein